MGMRARAGIVGALCALVLLAGCAQASARQQAGQQGAPPSANGELTAGTPLNGTPAPSFQLTDQYGKAISLAALRGHPVVLTFMDTTCTTQCPITAQYLDWTASFLGAKARQVEWVAISVNPTDTAAQADAFITAHKVTVPLHWLLGTQAQLQPVWRAYYIEVIPPTQPGGDVQHTVATYVLDQRGREMELLDQVFDPKQAAHDLALLLAQK